MDGNQRSRGWSPFIWSGPVWRSVDSWPRRDSFLLGGLLLLVDYLLVAIFIFVSLSALGRVALVVGAVPIIVYTVAELLHGFRPTQATLARADRLALIAFGTAFTVCVITIAVGALGGQLD